LNFVLAGVLVYVLAQLAVGAWVSRRIATEDDYLVAGRRLGYGLGIFTIFATWFGAETCIGAAGAIYENGLSGGSADPFGYGACIFLMGLLFAVPLWRRKLTTIADLFRSRFSRGVERFAVLLMVPTSLLWAAAQIRAFGQVLTDFIQGTALIVGLLILWTVVFSDNGFEVLASVDPSRLQLFGGGERPFLEVAESWAVPIFGSVVAAELVARVIACRSARVARRACIAAGSLYLVIGVIPVTLGLVGARMLPGLEHAEQLLPLLALDRLPPILYMFFAGALVSAILSTVDSALLVAASLVSHNVIVPMRPGIAERDKIRIARIGVAVFGVFAYVMALYAEGVYDLVEQASAFGSAGIVVIVTFGLFTRIGGAISAAAALTTGLVVWVVGSYGLDLPFAYIAALGSAVVAYLGVALIEPRPAIA
jgi:SSS family solute:Na+ symporter